MHQNVGSSDFSDHFCVSNPKTNGTHGNLHVSLIDKLKRDLKNILIFIANAKPSSELPPQLNARPAMIALCLPDHSSVLNMIVSLTGVEEVSALGKSTKRILLCNEKNFVLF